MQSKYGFLIIEEDKDVADILVEVMSRKEVRLFVATNLKSAYRVLSERNVDAVIMTHKMNPGEEASLWEHAREKNPKLIWVSIPFSGFPKAFVEPLSRVIYLKSFVETQAKIVDDFVRKTLDKECPRISEIQRDSRGFLILS